MDLAKFIDSKFEWSKRTFGPGLRTIGVTGHIRKELDEIVADPTDVEEWVDVVLLALDGASRAGHSGAEIVATMISKQEKCEARKWPEWSPEDTVNEHIKEGS